MTNPTILHGSPLTQLKCAACSQKPVLEAVYFVNVKCPFHTDFPIEVAALVTALNVERRNA